MESVLPGVKYSSFCFAQLSQLEADGLDLNYLRPVPAEATNIVSIITCVMQFEVIW